MKDRFHIDTTGNDNEAYREAMRFACQPAKDGPEIKRVILFAPTNSSTDWLERLYDSDTAKKCLTE